MTTPVQDQKEHLLDLLDRVDNELENAGYAFSHIEQPSDGSGDPATDAIQYLMAAVERLKEVVIQGFDLVQPVESPLTDEQEARICKEADAAYTTAKAAGLEVICPYGKRTRSYEVWHSRMMDAPLIHGDAQDDFEVLGQPTEVTLIESHADGSATYSIPAPYSNVQPA